jgi:hypothetical protein
MIALFRQVERFRVERWKRMRDGRWAWVTLGYFHAADMTEARQKGRDAIADKVCFLRAIPVGTEENR